MAYAEICAKEHETPVVHVPISHEHVDTVKESKSAPVEEESLIDTTQNTTIASEVVADQPLTDAKIGSEVEDASKDDDKNGQEEAKIETTNEDKSKQSSHKDIEEEKSPNIGIDNAAVEVRDVPPAADVAQKSDSDELVVVKDMKNYSAVLNLLKEYNLKFVKEWSRTYNFHKWKHEHHEICAFLESGSTSPKSSEFYKEQVSGEVTLERSPNPHLAVL